MLCMYCTDSQFRLPEITEGYFNSYEKEPGTIAQVFLDNEEVGLRSYAGCTGENGWIVMYTENDKGGREFCENRYHDQSIHPSLWHGCDRIADEIKFGNVRFVPVA